MTPGDRRSLSSARGAVPRQRCSHRRLDPGAVRTLAQHINLARPASPRTFGRGFREMSAKLGKLASFECAMDLGIVIAHFAITVVIGRLVVSLTASTCSAIMPPSLISSVVTSTSRTAPYRSRPQEAVQDGAGRLGRVRRVVEPVNRVQQVANDECQRGAGPKELRCSRLS